MDQNSDSAGGGALVDRVKAILSDPAAEWQVIEAEQAETREILRHYVVPLAAIGPLASFFGGLLAGVMAFGFRFRPDLVGLLGSGLVRFVLSLVGLFVLAAIANVLAPRFRGRADSAGAFRLVAYSATPALIAGICGLVPALGFVGLILGLYGIYLFHEGAPGMLSVPQDKATAFTGVMVLAWLVLFLVAVSVMTKLTRALL